MKKQSLKITQTILLIFLILLKYDPAFTQDENLNVLGGWIEWSDSDNMLLHHLNKQAFTYLDVRDEVINSLKTKADWLKRQQKVKDILMNIVGPFPEKTPLNPQVTGIVKKDGFSIEKIIYESLPGFYVTGCLFIPENGKTKKPAVLFLSGHTPDAFRSKDYQIMILNLVKKGFIVFAIDPISQGERIQHYNPIENASFIGPTTMEHSYLGNQCFISGVSLGRYFIWDGMRGIDYLLTRNEVDPERIGITGQSGGGLQTSFIFAFDDRIKASASVNYITGFRRLLESIGAQDAEQNLYQGILKGLTHADLLEVRAPRPSLIVAGTRDFFSIQGARETYNEVKNAYAAFGKEDNIGLVEDDWGHGYTKKIRENICDFFQKSFNLPENFKDEQVTILDLEELTVTKSGHVASSFADAETVFSLNKKETQKLIEKMDASSNNREQHSERIQLKAKELSGYMQPPKKVKAVFRGRYQRKGYSIEMYALQGEGEYVIPLLLFVPALGNNFPAVIYLHPEGKINDASPGGKIEQLVKKGYMVAAPDVIGVGEVKDNSDSYKYAAQYLSLMIGRSITGIQAGDVSRVVNFLKGRPDFDQNKIVAIAFDEMGPPLLHAAAFNKSIQTVALVSSLISYQSVIMNKYYDPDISKYFVAGALTAYDLPVLATSLAPRKLMLANINDGTGKLIDKAIENSEIEIIRTAYYKENATNQLQIVYDETQDEVFKQFTRFIK